MKIKVRHGESFDQALRRFNRKIVQEGILQEFKDRERYQKKSAIRHQKAKDRAHRIKLENKRRW
jgi:small subunit ribosomal protein S21